MTQSSDSVLAEFKQRLDDLLAAAKAAGAESADAILLKSDSLSLSQRLRNPEMLERAESQDLGLRVLIGKRQAIVSSTDLRDDALDDLVERAMAMARVVPEDGHCGLADPDELARGAPAIEMDDPEEPDGETLIARAREAEEAALSVKGVTNSDGAEASWGATTVVLAASNGFSDGYRITRHSVGVSVLAGEGVAMERDYDFHTTVFASDLESPALIGERAAMRAVGRLGPRKVKTARAPVVFAPRISGGLIGHLVGAISGPAVARGTSFLKDKMGERVFPAGFAVVDDPLRDRGLRSKPFDGEGLPTVRRNVIEDGVLRTWILDTRSARQLGLKSTGHASRGAGGPPSPSSTNLYVEPGVATPEALISDIKSGFYVTELMGFGVNNVTGDYSRGAAGFWIEDGQIAYPVSELTIAGNLKDMYRDIAAANDLRFRYGVNAPTLRVEGMTVAGS